ncbi:hypothetical protein BGW36DRAFT_390242 [Talaromyces proteolyticus]|uniref:Zn(2)-C6 fungal-type domain-containing protein n=1 Tax=Talaromyces proteolyticus TaxID=1131652 RepID=A0AAD4PVB6_9EURO|nr:uncharacterized protein BGW36DRAFT_390242 [Talaromyces proteolyticus]KAH8690118.1 hypothetical protein BGW36DRAFT_390242 [Talaromyces proteolyticus]
MESRGVNGADRSNGRTGIMRRSCDQCRTRKVGCDRGSPCSNCASSGINCTHSTIASKTVAPKQRVLISAQYEQKIDQIAKGIDSLTVLLSQNASRGVEKSETALVWHPSQASSDKDIAAHQTRLSSHGGDAQWDHSAHIIKFVKAVVDNRNPQYGDSPSEVVASLKKLLEILNAPATTLQTSHKFQISNNAANSPPMPPLEAVVNALRWAKDHQGYARIARIAQILPVDQFTEICRKVYFAVDDYSELDLILANGYLSYVFSERILVSGLSDYRKYFQICRENFHNGLAQLPLFLPPSMEIIAALTLGAFDSIANSNATKSWTFISAATNLCQTLGYHRLSPRMEGMDQSSQEAQNRLFWTIYKIDKGLSLQLGRPSNMRDDEITLLPDTPEPLYTRLGRIQGKVYDQLYSPVGLSRPSHERGNIAQTLAGQVRDIINETHSEALDATTRIIDDQTDPMQRILLQCDLVCQSSLLAMILRAVPVAPGLPSDVSDDCIAVARDVFDIHQKCMADLRSCKEPSLVTQYLSWAILHIPFVPFSILFTHAIQFIDTGDLDRLDRFALSLKIDTYDNRGESITHPYRVYELLYPTLVPISLGDLDLSGRFGMETDAEDLFNDEFQILDPDPFGLSDWYYSNQQIMRLLGEDVTL